MAGGVKLTTVVLLAVSAWSALRRRSQMVLGRVTLPAAQAHTSIMLVLLAGATLVITIALLLHTEEGAASAATRHGWLAVVFEAVSAFGTVGLSTGITEKLTAPGKGLIMVLMFVGRLGPLCLALHLAQPPLDPRIQYPEEEIAVG